jgi:hypothetical protein
MIFGFNTDVKHGETVYHVQSEASPSEQVLHTHIFVRGRCIGKHTISYADQLSQSGASEQNIQDILRARHRQVIGLINNGQVESIAELLAPELVIECLKADATAKAVLARFRISAGGCALSGIPVISRMNGGTVAAPAFAQASTGRDGTVELHLESEGPPSPGAVLLVQANYGGKTITQKFRLRPE